MSNRKKMRARHKAAKRRSLERKERQRFLDLESKLARSEEVAQYAVFALDEANRKLAGKTLVVLDYETRPHWDATGTVRSQEHVLRAQASTWRSRVGLQLGEKVLEMKVLLATDFIPKMTLPGELLAVRERLGSGIGAALLRDMRPRSNKSL